MLHGVVPALVVLEPRPTQLMLRYGQVARGHLRGIGQAHHGCDPGGEVLPQEGFEDVPLAVA